ncbi:MAG: hypothetical protein IPF87_04720 [Gemmatimonadetes bacterium]|nr:hypothetical protein [Gemmatimonadota bacterium]MBK7835240.1 hypothetical protein [Gemmatimonadota bacterium]MBK9406580.1 hypothetical protein [Gemmatimonadota bacterium]
MELTHTAVLQRIRADAAASERRRIESIRSLGMPGKERLVQLCIDSPTCTPEIAAAVLIKASRDEPSMQAALERIEKGLAILDPHGTIARS